MNKVINILHLEDDLQDVELIQESIISAGIKCKISVVSTEDAFKETLNTKKIDIILADYKLPMFDGIAAMKIAKKHYPDIPFIFVSGTMGEEAAIETLTHGATDYVLKKNLSRLPVTVERTYMDFQKKKEREQINRMINARAKILELMYMSEMSLNSICLKVCNEIEFLTASEISSFLFINRDWEVFDYYLESSHYTLKASKDDIAKQLDNLLKQYKIECQINKKAIVKNIKTEFSIQRENSDDSIEIKQYVIVPIIREKIVVAAVVVMNKSTVYSDMDIQTCNFLGDFLLEVVEKKRIEETLKISEEKHRSLFEYSPLPIMEEDFSNISEKFSQLRSEGIKDFDLYLEKNPGLISEYVNAVKTINVNRAAQTLFSVNDKVYSEINRLNYYSDLMGAFKQELVCLWNGQTEFSYDTTIRALNDEFNSITVFFSVCPGHEISLDKVFVSVIDITDRISMENKLKLNSKRFQMAQSIGHVGNWEYDFATKKIWGSDEAKRLFGFSIDNGEISIKEILKRIPERRRIYNELLELVEKNKEFKIEFEILADDPSKPKTLSSIAVLNQDREKKNLKIVGVIQDVTARKTVEKIVFQERENFFNILTAAPVGLLLLNTDFVVTNVNNAFALMVNKASADIIGKRIGEGIQCKNSKLNPLGCGYSEYCSDCPLQQILANAMIGSKEKTIDIRINIQENEEVQIRWFNFNFEQIQLNNQKHLIVAVDDITQKKQLESERILNIRFLEAIDQINRGLQGANSLNDLISSFLDTITTLLGCDRAWLANPCDLEANTHTFYFGLKISDNSNQENDESELKKLIVRDTFAQVLNKTNSEICKQKIEGIASCMTMAIYPNVGKPWSFGILYNTEEHYWSEREENLFHEAGIRFTDRLSNILINSELQTMLHELYHRTRNNMSVIISLLEFQSQRFENPRWREILTETQNRIHSMALVHEILQDTKELSGINMQRYIRTLVVALVSSFNITNSQISIDFQLEDVFLDIDYAIPCGLILNELLSNVFKHAFPDNRRGTLKTHISRTEGGKVLLLVADNGVGISSETILRNKETMGGKIINALAELQLGGTVNYNIAQGVECQILFSDTLYKKRM